MLHAPYYNFVTTIRLPAMPKFVFPSHSFVAVEKDKVSFLHTSAFIHVHGCLPEAIGDKRFNSLCTFDLQFQDDALHRASVAFG